MVLHVCGEGVVQCHADLRSHGYMDTMLSTPTQPLTKGHWAGGGRQAIAPVKCCWSGDHLAGQRPQFYRMQLLLLSGEAAVFGTGRMPALQLEKHEESGLHRR